MTTHPPRLTAQLDQLGAATTDAYRRLARLGATHHRAIALGPVLLTFGLCPRCLAHTEPTRKGNRS